MIFLGVLAYVGISYATGWWIFIHGEAVGRGLGGLAFLASPVLFPFVAVGLARGFLGRVFV